MTDIKPIIFIRTDANNAIGMGHLIRCFALAKMLESSFNVKFIFTNTDELIANKFLENSFDSFWINGSDKLKEADAVTNYVRSNNAYALILDGYQFDSEYQKKVYDSSFKLIYIDDLINPNYFCDLVINQADILPECYKTNKQTKYLLGVRYVLLRPDFLKAAKDGFREINSIKNIFISFGGADFNNTTLKVLKALLVLNIECSIHILSGPLSQNSSEIANLGSEKSALKFYANLSSSQVKELIANCDLALIPNSNLSLEACAVRILMITGITTNNQLGYYNSFQENKLSLGIGNWDDASEDEIVAAVKKIINFNSDEKKTQLLNQHKYIDGFSSERILHHIKTI